MANNENTLAPAGGGEPIGGHPYWESAPASAPLPLTDERIDEIADSLPAIPLSWERDREFARRIARAALSGGSPEPGSEGEEEGGKRA